MVIYQAEAFFPVPGKDPRGPGGRVSVVYAWRVLAGFPDYEIRSDGVVRRITPDSLGRFGGQIIKDRPYGKYRHRMVSPRDSAGIKHHLGVHVLVALTFIGPRPSAKHEVAHNDGVPWNNLYTNLRWDTRKGNHSDRKAHGTLPVGEANGRVKLTDVLVAEIKAALIAQPYGCGKASRCKIWRRHEHDQPHQT